MPPHQRWGERRHGLRFRCLAREGRPEREMMNGLMLQGDGRKPQERQKQQREIAWPKVKEAPLCRRERSDAAIYIETSLGTPGSL